MKLPGAFASASSSAHSSEGKTGGGGGDNDEVVAHEAVRLDGLEVRGPITRARVVALKPWSVEDRAGGKINCPSGRHGTAVRLRGCNHVMCTGCNPWVVFCFYCKQELEDDLPCSSCKSVISLSRIQELASGASGGASRGGKAKAVAAEEDVKEDDEEEDATSGTGDVNTSDARPAKRTRR
jgi:hypothetical protein